MRRTPSENPPSAAQVRAARALLGWEQSHLAERVKVTAKTISAIERAEPREKVDGRRVAVVEAVRRALVGAGIEFLREDESGGEGVRRRKVE